MLVDASETGQSWPRMNPSPTHASEGVVHGSGRDESGNGDGWESHRTMAMIRDGRECHLLSVSTWDSLAEDG
jgi:hypothetical protein